MPTITNTTTINFVKLSYSEQHPREDLPLDPIGPPVMIPERTSKRAGHFFVDLSTAAPQPVMNESNDTTDIDVVVFLFRFVDNNSSNVFFNWTVRSIIL